MTYDKEYARDHLGADCDHCPLDRIGRFVPSVGPEQAAVAFVGEAPGVQEARNGVPFSGPSGRLLNIVNDNYDIKRSEVFLSNACLCRPPSNDTPAKSAIAACRPRLLHELVGRGVDTAVALGNSAALSLLGVEGVTKLRVGPGRQSPYEGLEHIRIIPTIHPAACLRQSDMFPSLVADVAKVKSPMDPWTEPEVIVYDTPEGALGLIERIGKETDEVYLDIEVDIDKDTSYDHPDRYGMLCIGFCYEDNIAHVIGENALKDEAVIAELTGLLSSLRLDAQNGKFDLAGLFPVLGPLELHFDTMLAHYCLDERTVGIHGLKAMATEELGAPDYDAEIKRYVGRGSEADEDGNVYYGYGKIPRPILYKYNGYDVVAGYRLKKKLEPKLEAGTKPEWWDDTYCGRYPFKNLRELHDFLVASGNELMFLELNGIKVDRSYLMELWEKYESSLEVIEGDLNKVLIKAGYNAINPRSPKQVMGAMQFFRLRAQNTAKDTLNLIVEQMQERYGEQVYDMDLYNFVTTLLQYRDEHKMFSTYVKGIHKRTFRSRVYPTFKLHGTVTGRLSSRNPNMQNIPRRKAIKRIFVPSAEDRVFVNADYKQAELRTLSWLADEPFLKEILDDPARDLFDELTPGMYKGLTKADVGTIVSEEEWKDIRVRVKAFVYGLGYGRKYQSIAYEYRLPMGEAKQMAEGFMAQIPNVVAWQAWVREHVKSGRDLITPFGRHRRFHLITDENWEDIQNEALAFLPQSTSSDVCLRAMARVRRDLRGTGAFIRNIVHDNILVDCPADMANDVSVLLDTRMGESGRELVGDYVKYAVDISIGKNWGEV